MKEVVNGYTESFSEKKLWKKIAIAGKKAGIKVVYAVLLLFYAFRRKETPSWAKTIILGVLGYFLSPIDAIPDLTPVIGYTDDLGVLLFGLVTIASYINDQVRVNARTKLEKWFGAFDKAQLEEVDEKL